MSGLRKFSELDLGSWSAAWDQYLLAAVMLEQLTFEQALLHKKVRVVLVVHACACVFAMGVACVPQSSHLASCR